MMLAIRYVTFSAVLFGFWCSSHGLPAAHAQDPVTEAEQAVNDAQRKVQAAQTAANEAQKQADGVQQQVDAATQERDLAQVLADKKKATFQNAKDGTEALAEGAFVAAATALNEKQQNLANWVRAQQAAANAVKTKNEALTTAQTALKTAQTTLSKAEAADGTPGDPPDLGGDTCAAPLDSSAATINELTDFINDDPGDRSLLIARGQAYLGARLPSAAETDFRQILRSDPDDIEAMVGWARVAEGQQCWQTAADRYGRAITAAQRTNQPMCLYSAYLGRARSHVHLATGDDANNRAAASADDQSLLHCEAAVRDFTQAIRYAPSDIDDDDLEAAQDWIKKAQRWQKAQSDLNATKAAR